MTRRVVRVTTALVLSTGLIASAMIADAASKTRGVADKVVAKVEDNAKLAPKYETSYGEARPECREKKMQTEACWSKNRRADILVRHASAQVP